MLKWPNTFCKYQIELITIYGSGQLVGHQHLHK